MKPAQFIDGPKLFTEHTLEQCFCGQAVIEISPRELWLFAHYGATPATFRANQGSNDSLVFKSTDGGRNWQGPDRLEIEYSTDGLMCEGGRSVLHLKSGKIIMVSHRSSNIFRSQGSHGIPVITHSSDGGKTWSPIRLLTNEPEDYIYSMNQRLIQMQNGRLLLAVSGRDKDATPDEYHEGVHPTVGFCYISDDDGINWKRSTELVRQHTERGVQEPAVVEYTEGKLIMLFRSGLGCHQANYSDDNGETWSKPQDTTLTAACAPLALAKIPDGRLIVVYNHAIPLSVGSYFPRNPLVYAVSNDAQTWSNPILIDDQLGQQLIYPSITSTLDGVLIVYSAHYAASDGSFDSSDDAWTIGGGKCCVIMI